MAYECVLACVFVSVYVCASVVRIIITMLLLCMLLLLMTMIGMMMMMMVIINSGNSHSVAVTLIFLVKNALFCYEKGWHWAVF